MRCGRGVEGLSACVRKRGHMQNDGTFRWRMGLNDCISCPKLANVRSTNLDARPIPQL